MLAINENTFEKDDAALLKTTSLGINRPISLMIFSDIDGADTSVRLTAPVETSTKQIPAVSPTENTLARKLFLPSLSMLFSITVPGVRTLVTSRLTSPLARAGSSVCSQTATLYPFATRRAI